MAGAQVNYTIAEGFRDCVLRSTAVQDLLADTGAGTTTYRIYPNTAPQSAIDNEPSSYATYFIVSRTSPRHLGGPIGLTETRIQVDVYARTYILAQEIAETIRENVDGFNGEISGTNGSMLIRGVRLEDMRDQYEFGDSSESGWHRVSLDFAMWHSQSVAVAAVG
jgi:hypothetical protein